MSSTGSFLPVQLVYTGKTWRCFLDMIFQPSFLLASPKINRQKQKDPSSFLKKLSFPVSRKRKRKKVEQHSLVIMDTLKGQNNVILKKICSENRCEIVIASQNLTNKFQPLDLIVNKAAKAFIQNQYND